MQESRIKSLILNSGDLRLQIGKTIAKIQWSILSVKFHQEVAKFHALGQVSCECDQPSPVTELSNSEFSPSNPTASNWRLSLCHYS